VLGYPEYKKPFLPWFEPPYALMQMDDPDGRDYIKKGKRGRQKTICRKYLHYINMQYPFPSQPKDLRQPLEGMAEPVSGRLRLARFTHRKMEQKPTGCRDERR
jgi:hypothetical protein